VTTSPLQLSNDGASGASPGTLFHPLPDVRDAHASRTRPGALSQLAAGVRDNAVIFAVLVPYVALAFVVDALTDVPVAGRLLSANLLGPLARTLRLAVVLIAVSVVWFAVRRLRDRWRAQSGGTGELLDLGAAWARFPLRPTLRRVSRLFVCMAAYALFLHVFVGFKAAIPLFHPFAWDGLFAGLDRAILLGHDPWRVLQPLVGRPAITNALDVLYYAWFPVNLLMVAWFGWMDDTWERRRFFLAYLLTWAVLGNLVALVFSSVGPCFFELVAGTPGPYAELMTYLRGVDTTHGLTALEVQAMLLNDYHSGEMHPIEGIAAMPSLHVAVPFLFMFLTACRSRLVAAGFGVFGVTILIGSVHLGWHYAVDGYAAIAGAWVVCWAVERARESVGQGDEVLELNLGIAPCGSRLADRYQAG
jgi:hypothetical protein